MKNQLSTEDLQKLHSLKKTTSDLISSIGELGYQKMSLDLEIEKKKEELKEHKIQELSFFDYLRSNYANGVLNIETGEIK